MELKPQYTHENPDILHVGTCPDRSYYIPFAGEEEALKGTSSRVISLNGTWAFRYFSMCYSMVTDPENLRYQVRESCFGGGGGC